jgi:hypothetical protein
MCWGCEVKFISHPLQSRERTAALTANVGGRAPKTVFGVLEKENSLVAANIRTSVCPAHSLVSIPPTLQQLNNLK